MTKKIIITLTIILTLIAIGSVIYLFQQTPQQSKLDNTQAAIATSTQSSTSISQKSIAGTSTAVTTHPGMKHYRNEEFGFEFWYPEGWWIEVNHNINPFIKLEVIIKPTPNENFASFSVLISTLEHANYVVDSIRSRDTRTQAVIDGRNVIRHDFEEGTVYIDYIIFLTEHAIIVSNENKEHVPEFNQILSTFKLIK